MSAERTPQSDTSSAAGPTVEFEPIGRRIAVAPGSTLLEAAQQAGIDLVALCGGVGACDSCQVRLMRGRLSPLSLVEEALFDAEQIAAGWRLACQSRPLGDVTIDVPPDSLTTAQRLQLEGESVAVAHDPAILPVDLRLEPPTLHDLRSDTARLRDALGAQGIGALQVPLPVLRDMPGTLRAADWSVRVAIRENREIAAVLPAGRPLLGYAVDIGTTSIAVYLVDLDTGEILARAGAMNPQIAYGEDVISRILFITEHAGRGHVLQEGVVTLLNETLERLCAEVGADPGQVVDAVVVGNTAMGHIFAGLPVRQLGEAPYVPAVSEALTFPAAAVGLRLAPGATVYMPPVIAGFVGGDHIATLLAAGTWQAAGTTITIDIGTNTEVSLTHQGKLFSCSCASGPAFEGAHIRDGMRAAPGAIERVQVLDGTLHIQTIDHAPAVGICGSGILDAIAVMVAQRVVTPRGAFQPAHPLTRLEDGKPAFVLAAADAGGPARAVAVTRKDVAEIQLAKSAIRTGIAALLDEAGIPAESVESFVIAGAFGTYINVSSAVQIGMFPSLPAARFRQVGNAAGMGARQLLISRALRDEAARLAERITYIELTTRAGFQDAFVEYMTLTAG